MMDSKNIFQSFFSSKRNIILLILVVVFGISLVVLYVLPSFDETNSCFVYFDTDGGSEIFSEKIPKGSIIKRPTTPKKDGFTFDSWQVDGEVFDFENTPINDSIVVTAKWKVNEGTEVVNIYYQHTLNPSIRTIQIKKGATTTPPSIAMINGFEFAGWYKDEEKYDFLQPIYEDVSILGMWNKDNLVDKKCAFNKRDNATKNAWEIPLNGAIQFNSYYGYWNHNDYCSITYEMKDLNIATVTAAGLVTGRQKGDTELKICIVDIVTNETVDCYDANINVVYFQGSKTTDTVVDNLLFQLKNYYWYLDGYSYAYIYPYVENENGQEKLLWDSKYIDLVNNTFVTTEETGTLYDNSEAIKNVFNATPASDVYKQIQKYNMSIKNNKLYITMGDQTYTFNKQLSKVNVNSTITTDNYNLTVDTSSPFSFEIHVAPLFVNYNLQLSSSNITVVNSCEISALDPTGKATVSCYANVPGESKILIRDTNSTAMTNVSVAVK